MPVNASIEYIEAERKYLDAGTMDEKIAALEEMIRYAPKHKGAENLLARLRFQLSKLKKEKIKKSRKKGRGFGIPKEGAAQVCILGFANSGKSTLLKTLTGVGEPSDIPYSTEKPVVGMMIFEGVHIQMVEIPSTFEPKYVSVSRSADANIFLTDMTMPGAIEKALDIMRKERISKAILVANKCDIASRSQKQKGFMPVSALTGQNIDSLKKTIWDSLGLIRIYTRGSARQKKDRPLTLRKGATVYDAARNIHKDMVKFFKFARVWGSTKFPGTKVGLDYVLHDKDVLEIRIK